MGYNSKYTGAEVENLLDKAGTALQGEQYKGTITSVELGEEVDDPDLGRKVKEAKDLENNELIYLKGHAKATYMSDGRSVEDAINQIGAGGGTVDLSGYATKDELANKVDKVDGKQLSTEDFTTLLKQKLDGLQNYDDTEVQQAVSKLRTDLDTLVSGDTTTAIETFNEVIAFLEGVSDTEDLEGIIASIEQQIAGKQDKIDDLETIRSGASKGATALQGDGVVMRIEKVSALPTNPDANTLYIIV